MERKIPDWELEVPAYAGLLGLSEAQAAWPIEEAIARGLPRDALQRVAQAISPDPAAANKLIHAVVPKSSLSRRGTLTPAQGEQTERLARLFAYARLVFGDAGDARAFMHNPHPELQGRRPVDAALTELGGRAVERVLDALAYGLPV
ncbi:MAG TPA: antitoxin Xre/MbcA/ParS toxin-binding domain-containing protein [Acetobacteraceae bacterium]|jgi:putative toxin-antitoxin system antitoxin component (TIGR02293 family)|nr:antitoxin Xre/MbcA/ParS toxin-binding domain-containing protein [Acetobacteraceae bacterium]